MLHDYFRDHGDDRSSEDIEVSFSTDANFSAPHEGQVRLKLLMVCSVFKRGKLVCFFLKNLDKCYCHFIWTEQMFYTAYFLMHEYLL